MVADTVRSEMLNSPSCLKKEDKRNKKPLSKSVTEYFSPVGLWSYHTNLTTFVVSFFWFAKHDAAVSSVMKETSPSALDPVSVTCFHVLPKQKVPFAFLQVTGHLLSILSEPVSSTCCNIQCHSNFQRQLTVLLSVSAD